MTLHLTMSLDDFLQRPEVKPYEEYHHGRVARKSMPSFPHSLVQAELARRLGNWAAGSGGYVVTEQRCILSVGTTRHVLLPDVAFFPPGRFAQMPARAVEVAPLLAVEVLSPDDRYGEVQDKVLTYLEAGVELVWVVDPLSRNVTMYRPGRPPRVEARILSGPMLSGLSIPLMELFAKLEP